MIAAGDHDTWYSGIAAHDGSPYSAFTCDQFILQRRDPSDGDRLQNTVAANALRKRSQAERIICLSGSSTAGSDLHDRNFYNASAFSER